ncbi:hypothetical protein SAMN05445871_1000 [Paraburkholderia caballeronis]|uniref:Uncharacterized protein n=1 Tax=Paraburkholderia caballeronis TaxID=416943 RepID=A0A1H7PJA8_9BURK|nr:hypothetical protein C7403_1072 [Paraburkholderia caballeronis]PXW99969.1 hypothetical protein C7407_1072 [Paraburkholderia caballeronis]RAJ97099.1 hypothetical protein C7409_1072 [Paraburkholderia caballeronis]SEB75195.1 hypothetical protein SAMN05445871_1000 [Paraburkholderia caballeronis]SEL35365.1 hypothetical protein SAMN05192542_1072 [Paraburkholderia caballeronis]
MAGTPVARSRAGRRRIRPSRPVRKRRERRRFRKQSLCQIALRTEGGQRRSPLGGPPQAARRFLCHLRRAHRCQSIAPPALRLRACPDRHCGPHARSASQPQPRDTRHQQTRLALIRSPAPSEIPCYKAVQPSGRAHCNSNNAPGNMLSRQGFPALQPNFERHPGLGCTHGCAAFMCAECTSYAPCCTAKNLAATLECTVSRSFR